MTYDEAEHILQSFTIEEILEYNDLDEVDLIRFLLEKDFVILPLKPLDFE